MKFVKLIRSKGYSFDYSKSNNAINAENVGKYPLSVASKILSKSLKIKQNQAKWLLEKIGPSEWHHTSSWYNSTDYYDTDIENIIDYLQGYTETADISTAQDVIDYVNSKFVKKQKPNEKSYYADFDYLVWSGTRNYPKAEEFSLENVFIVEKGAFYYVYKNEEDYKNNDLIVKKKKDSRGTRVYHIHQSK